MKKRYIALLICLLVLAVSFQVFATEQTHDGNCEYHSSEALTAEYIPWESANSLPTASGRYYLTCDVDALANTHTISGEVDIILCLNGHTIQKPASNKRTLRLQNGAQLTLCDCTATSEGEVYQAGSLIPGGAEQGGAVGIYPRLGNDKRNTVFTLRDGIIDGSGITNSANGGAINLSQNDASTGQYFAEFVMLGGEIRNCASKQNGGVAVLGSGGKFTLAGGSITGCSAGFGGGVIYSNNGHFEMTGGTIRNCTSPKGGVARIEGTATMTIKGGSLENCRSTGTGGAVHMQGGAFRMESGAISGCTATGNGGAICLDGYNAVIELTGGRLTGNTAAYGGAIFFKNTDNTASLTVENMTITGNTASRGGGIEYFAAAGVSMTVGGQTVIADNMTRMGYPNNINLVSGSRQLQLGAALAEGSRIGISSRDAYAKNFTVIAAGMTEETAAYFFSDEGHNMVCADGALQQAVHTHAGADYHATEETFTPWGAAYAETMALPLDSGFYQLTADLYLNGTTTISGPVDIVLCLNGYDIHAGGEKRILYLTGGAQVTICDCTANGSGAQYVAGRLIPGTETGGAVGIYPSLGNDSRNTVLTLRDGIIDGTGVESPNGGAAVNLSQKDGTTGENKAIFCMEGGQIRNCTSGYRGGAVMIQSGGIWKLTGGEVRTCSAPTGGAAYVGNGTLEMTGGLINGCASDNGGAVYGAAESKLLLTGGILEQNRAVYGGGISAMKDSALTLQGITVRENTADYGGGIYGHCAVFTLEEGTAIEKNMAAKTGAGIMLGGGAELTVNGGTVIGNHAVQTDGDGAFGHGAGILAQGENTKLTIRGGKIADNIADGDGGGIYMSRQTVLTLSGGEISGNSAKNGGGVYHLGSTGSYKGGALKNNIASVTGGGLLVGGESKVTLTGSAISGNRAESGGGLVIQGKSRFSMTGGEISGNQAKNGGGLYGSHVNLVVSGGTFRGNHAKEAGGAMIVTGGSLSMTGGKVTENTATHGGGAVIQSGAAFRLENGSFTGNTTVGDGAAIYISRKSSLEMTGGKVSGNKAGQHGGGVYHLESTGAYNGGVIENNIATLTGGGIILGGESKVTLDGTTVCGNRAETGGGVLIQGKGQFSMPSGTVCGNSASINGGGIYGWKVDYTIGKDAVVCHNTAAEVGGGMVCYSGKLVVEGTVSHNKALHAGGISSLGAEATLELYGAVITDNQSHGDGAGIYVGAGSALTAENVQILNNLAGNDGAGVYLMGSTGVLKAVQLEGNMALRNGGGLFAGTNTTVNLTDSAFLGNTAKHGGGTYNTADTVLRLNQCTMADNIAVITGSAVWSQGNTALNDVQLTGNAAEQGYTVHALGVTKLTGNTAFADNAGVLPGLFPEQGGKTTVDNLGEQAHILVQTGGAEITDVLGGSYNYTQTDSGYTVTAGDQSTQEETEETVPTPTEEPIDSTDTNKALPFILLALAAVLTAVAVVIALKKEKK